MNIGYCVIGSSAGVEFRLFGSGDDATSLVQFSRSADASAVLMGRLYYRDALLPTLGLVETENDAAVALAAYRRWGRAGLERLEGDYSLVIHDQLTARVVASRDPMGGYPLFWCQRGNTLGLATSIYALLPLLAGASFDVEFLADFMTLPGQVQEMSSERCAYDGVRRLAPGAMATFNLRTGAIERRTWWDWLERRIDPGTDQQEEAGAAYVELVRRATAERLRGRTASHLSGGMDSTTISLLARQEVLRRGDADPLHTISLVYNRLPGLTGETEYIDAATEDSRGLCQHRVAADDLLDFDAFSDPDAHDEPYPGLWRMGLDRATIEAAARCGAETLLTGIGADEMLVMSPFHVADLLRSGRVFRAWSELCKWGAADNCSPWTLLYPYGLSNVLPAWTCGGLRAALRGGRADWGHQNQWTIAPWITDEFARDQFLRRRAVEAARQTFRACRPTVLSFALYLIRSRLGDVDRWSLGAPRGVHVAHPFLDPRVLCYGLGMKTRMEADPHGQKPVLAKGVKGILPDKILHRRRKGDFDRVYGLGLARNLEGLRAMVESSPLAENGMFDKGVLLDCLQRAALGASGRGEGTHRLNLTLSLIKWAAMQRQWRRPRAADQVVCSPAAPSVVKAVRPPAKIALQSRHGRLPLTRS